METHIIYQCWAPGSSRASAGCWDECRPHQRHGKPYMDKWIKSLGCGNRTQFFRDFDSLTSTARASNYEWFSILFAYAAQVTVGWFKFHPVSSSFTYLLIGWSTEAPVSRLWAPSWTSRATRARRATCSPYVFQGPDGPWWSLKVLCILAAGQCIWIEMIRTSAAWPGDLSGKAVSPCRELWYGQGIWRIWDTGYESRIWGNRAWIDKNIDR